MEPSKIILTAAATVFTVTDKAGRRLSVRRPTALDTLRLFKAAGPVLAQNEPWLAMASLAFSVQEIDGVPVPSPLTEAQIEALVDRLGEQGLTAISAAISPTEESSDTENQAGNSLGTPC